MSNKKLLEKVNQLGLPLFSAEESFDAPQTLAEVVAGKDLRLLEGFPVLLANTAKSGTFDYTKVARALPTSALKNLFQKLFLMSLALFRYKRLSFSWTDGLFKRLSSKDENTLGLFLTAFKEGKALLVGDKPLSSQRVQELFENYFEAQSENTARMQSQYEELSLEFALSQVFSPKQKELFKKKLNGLPLTKTEREYFSRTVKKKVQALANAGLHNLARRLLE